ncbi:MAG: hypothetical protein WC291_01760 [Thermodesulfovibrionales bacterium]|jgi:hypothetical protein
MNLTANERIDQEKYWQICRALDFILNNSKKFKELQIQKSVSPASPRREEVTIIGFSMQLCKAILQAITGLEEPSLFRSELSISHFWTCLSSKAYVEDAFYAGEGWMIEGPVALKEGSRYLLRRKR